MRTLLETRQLTQAQENECGQVTIGFGFAFYRLRDWGEFFFFQTNHRLSGENQTQATLELILLVTYSSISKLLIKQLQGKPLYINTSSLNED